MDIAPVRFENLFADKTLARTLSKQNPLRNRGILRFDLEKPLFTHPLPCHRINNSGIYFLEESH